MAKVLGVSRRTAGDYVVKGMPRNIAKCAEWRTKNIRPRVGGIVHDDRRHQADTAGLREHLQVAGSVGGEASPIDNEAFSPTHRKTLAEVEKLKQEIRQKTVKADQLEARVVLRDEAEQKAAIVCAAIRARLEAIPEEMAMELSDEQRRRLKSRIELALRELEGFEV